MGAIWEIIVRPAWYWLVTIIPAALAVITAIQGGMPVNQQEGLMYQLYNTIPFWMWIIIAAVAYTVTILISANSYVNHKVQEANEKIRQTEEKMLSIQTNASGGGIANSVGTLYGGIHHNAPAQEKKSPPNIIVGISGENGSLSQKKTFHLGQLPEKPNIEDMMGRKRTELLARTRTVSSPSDNPSRVDEIVSMMMKPSSNYPAKVEEYLIRYREYLIKDYGRLLMLSGRYHSLQVNLENRSERPANQVILELYLPANFQIPSADIERVKNEMEFYASMSGEPVSKYGIRPPAEPELFEPLGSSFEFGSITAPVERIERDPRSFDVSNRNGVNIVTYRIDYLIQNRSYTDLFPIHLLLEDGTPTSSQIHVQVNAEELPQPVDSYIDIELIVR